MSNSWNDISQNVAQFKPTFDPQNLVATGAGRAINVADVGMNIINARLLVGDAVALTSLDVKMQAAVDDGSGSPDAGSWVDITGLDGSVVAFTQVTDDPGTNGVVPQTIPFKLPSAATLNSKPYIWVRAYATLVGTSILMAVELLGCRRYDQLAANQNHPGSNTGGYIN